MHNHSKCEHKLEYCKICDVVYCNMCKEEWKKHWNGFTNGGVGSAGNGIGGLQYYTDGPNVVLCNHEL